MTNKTKPGFSFIAAILLLLVSCNRERKNETTEGSNSKITEDAIDVPGPDTLEKDEPAFFISAPICIDYSEAGVYSSSEKSFYEIAKKEKKYLKAKTRLTEKFVKQQLFLNADSVFIQNIWSGDTVEKKSYTNYIDGKYFYLTDTVLRTQLFNGIVYEATGDEGSEKYLYTFNQEGKLISKISIAFYRRSGSATADDGSRMPWYELKKGCIEKDLTINFICQTPVNKKYKIQTDGKIVETN